MQRYMKAIERTTETNNNNIHWLKIKPIYMYNNSRSDLINTSSNTTTSNNTNNNTLMIDSNKYNEVIHTKIPSWFDPQYTSFVLHKFSIQNRSNFLDAQKNNMLNKSNTSTSSPTSPSLASRYDKGKVMLEQINVHTDEIHRLITTLITQDNHQQQQQLASPSYDITTNPVTMIETLDTMYYLSYHRNDIEVSCC